MHRKKIEDLFQRVKTYVEQDSSSLTRDDQDRILLLVGNTVEQIGEVYDGHGETGKN